MLRTLGLRLVIACVAAQAAFLPCFAGDAPRLETYVTADYSGRAVGLASSTVWSASGPIDQPGFRLKFDGFANVYGDTNANVFSSAFMAGGLKTLTAVAAGYQFNWEDFWIKLYAGGAYQAQARIIWQAGLAVQQQDYGAMAAIESYWRGSGPFWASANLSWLQPGNTASFYGRAAYELYRDGDSIKFSAGGESGAMVSNADIYKEGRNPG